MTVSTGSQSIDVIVPVHGNWPVVERCLTSLVGPVASVHYRVIVVDDRSPDDTADRVEAAFPDVDLLRMSTNVGFAAACNAGFAHGSGDVVVLVNSDVEVGPGMLGALAGAFGDPTVASAGPVITRPDGRLDAVGICADPTLAGFVRYHGASPSAASHSGPALLGPYGAVAAYRRSAMPSETLFDEGIFMYGEELDLALRLRAAGYATRTVLDAHAVHLGGATTGKGSSRQRYLAGFGRGYLLGKYRVLRSRQALRAIATEAIVIGLRVARDRESSALRGRVDGFRAGRRAPAAVVPVVGLEPRIGFLRSLRMRSEGYWSRY